MRATFVVPMQNANALLPPMDAGPNETQLHYLDGQGVLRGGFSCVGQVPTTSSAIVLIDSSQATIDQMTLDYVLVEVLPDAEPIE